MPRRARANASHHIGGTEQHRRSEDKLLRVRTCWSHFERLLVPANEQGSGPSNKGKKGNDKGKGNFKGKDKDSVNEVTTLSETVTTEPLPVKSRESPRTPTLGIVPSRPMEEDKDEEYETGCILAAIRHREPFRQSKDLCVVRTYWWTTVRMSTCALHETLSGSPSSQSGIPTWYRQVDTN